MNKKSQLGQLGENIACRYLVENKYKIIERNFRQKWGEIDIIAKAPDRTLVFAEVKTVRQYNEFFVNNNDDYDNDKIRPEDQLTKAKLQKLQRTASLYAGHHPELVKDNKGWRIDLIAIIIKADSECAELLTNQDKCCIIEQYQNIVFQNY